MCAWGSAVKSQIPTVPFGQLPSQVGNSNKSATTMDTCSPKDPCTAAVPSVVFSVAAVDNVVVVVVVVIGADEDVAAVVAAVVASVVAVRFFIKIFQIIPLKEDQTCGGTICGTSCGASICLEVGGHCQDHTAADHLAHRYPIFLCPLDVEIEIIIKNSK